MEGEKNSGKFNCDFKLKDNKTGRQEFMNIKVAIVGEEVTVTLRSSIDGFETFQATGTKQVIPNGVMISASGDIDSVGYSFNSEVTSNGQGNVVIKWRVDYGSRYSIILLSENAQKKGQLAFPGRATWHTLAFARHLRSVRICGA